MDKLLNSADYKYNFNGDNENRNQKRESYFFKQPIRPTFHPKLPGKNFVKEEVKLKYYTKYSKDSHDWRSSFQKSFDNDTKFEGNQDNYRKRHINYYNRLSSSHDNLKQSANIPLAPDNNVYNSELLKLRKSFDDFLIASCEELNDPLTPMDQTNNFASKKLSDLNKDFSYNQNNFNISSKRKSVDFNNNTIVKPSDSIAVKPYSSFKNNRSAILETRESTFHPKYCKPTSPPPVPLRKKSMHFNPLSQTDSTFYDPNFRPQSSVKELCKLLASSIPFSPPPHLKTFSHHFQLPPTDKNKKKLSPVTKEAVSLPEEDALKLKERRTYRLDSTGFSSDECITDDEGLDDKKEAFTGLEFSRPAIDQCNLPIVPAHQHLLNEKKGNLYKYTTKVDSSTSNKLASKLVNTWQKRWVTLDQSFLRYYANSKSMVSRKVVPICTMSDVQQETKNSEHHRFKIILNNKKTLIFAAETADDLSIWTSLIMRAIIDHSMKPNAPLKQGGDLHDADVEGYSKIEGMRGRKYMACKKDLFAVYNDHKDYLDYAPICLLSLQLCNVREASKLKLNISNPYSSPIVCSFNTQEELVQWKSVLEANICLALGGDEVLDKVYANESNKNCADCQQAAPEWAAINYGITLCHNCSGIHRQFSNAKVRSLRMDVKVWSEDLIQMMLDIGNQKSNQLWGIPNHIDASSDLELRKEHITNKYQLKTEFKFHEFKDNQEALDKLLIQNVCSNNLLLTIQLIFSGANAKLVLESLSESEINSIQAEILRQNINS